MEQSPIAVETVRDLQESRKRVLEDMLGQKLEENQQVFITVFTPDLAPNDEKRRAALASLEQAWARVAEHMQADGATDEQFDAAVDEAMDHIRHRES